MADPGVEKIARIAGKKVWLPSTITTEELSLMAPRRHGFQYRTPLKDETPEDVQEGELCLFLEYFKVGLELPLPQFLVEFCNATKLLPRLIMPNSLAILKGLYLFLSKWSIPWELEHILSLLTFTEREGMYYAQPKHSSEFKITGLASSRHGWKDKYFFMKSKQPWPIHTNIVVPLPHSLKDGKVSSRIAELKNSFDNRPFSLDVNTLEVTAIEDIRPKRKGKGIKTAVSKKQRATKATAKDAAETGFSEPEGSIRWSEIAPESRTIRRKLPFRKAQPAEAKGKGKAAAEEGSEEEVAAKEPITETEQEAAAPAPTIAIPEGGPEAAGTSGGDEPEYIINKENKTITLKQNLKRRYVPDFTPSRTPYVISDVLLHPDDLDCMKKSSTRELGERDAYLAQSSSIITKFLCERSMAVEGSWKAAEKDAQQMSCLAKGYKGRWKKAKAELEAANKKAAEETASRDADVQKLLSKEEEEKSKLREEIEQLKAALVKATTEVDEARSTISINKAKYDRELNVQKEVIKALKASMEKTFSPPPVVVTSDPEKNKIIEEYKESDDFYLELKNYGAYGFILLKKHLEKNKLLPRATLDTLQYDQCIEEASDEESDNGAS